MFIRKQRVQINAKSNRKQKSKISASANDDKRIQTLGKIISYPYGTGLRRTDDTSESQ